MTIPGVCRYLVSCWMIGGLASTGCNGLLGKEPNPGYCAHPPCAAGDGGGCTKDTDCASPAGVCDTTANQCVQCTATDHAACAGTTPVCGTDDTCRACAAHSECAADACSFADGSCVAETDVAYVDSAGTNNTACGRLSPCTSLIAGLGTGKPFVRVRGTIDEAIAFTTGRVTILADRGATLTHDGAAPVLTVSGPVSGADTSLTIYDLTISDNHLGGGVSVAAGAGMTNLSLIHTTISGHDGEGIRVESGAFTLARSAITSNRDGGVVIDGTATFFIVGNTFFANGSMTSTTGAVRISARQAPSNRLDFNSLLKNQNQDRGGAIDCSAGPTFTARNNIIDNPAQLADPLTGSCAYAYSLIQPASTAQSTHPVVGADPMFVDPINGDMHLMSGSPALHAADPAADVSGLALDDMDGKPRMPPPATIGAYQMQ